jgi:hypothetical protein
MSLHPVVSHKIKVRAEINYLLILSETSFSVDICIGSLILIDF